MMFYNWKKASDKLVGKYPSASIAENTILTADFCHLMLIFKFAWMQYD